MITNAPVDIHKTSLQLLNSEMIFWIINGTNSAIIQIITIDAVKLNLIDFDFTVLRMEASMIYENKIATIEL